MKRLTLGIMAGLLLFCIVILITNILPTRRQYDELNERKQELTEEKDRLAVERQRLDLLGDALENDPMTVERTLRKWQRHSLPGERVFWKKP